VCFGVGVDRGRMGSYWAGVAAMSFARCRGHRPVGVGLQETTKFLGDGESTARVDNRGGTWGLDRPSKQHYRGVGGGCSFSSHRGQESERPAGLNQVKVDLIEQCLLRSQVAH